MEEIALDNNYYKYVKDLVNNHYVVGAYQRGYRWDSNNVTELLNDMFEGKLIEHYDEILKDENLTTIYKKLGALTEKRESGHYCIQPIVVSKKGDVYSVIDGQ